MAPLAIEIIAGLFAAAIVLAFTLDFLEGRDLPPPQDGHEIRLDRMDGARLEA